MVDVFAVVVAAGLSRRMGENMNKLLLPLAGRPVLAHSLAMIEDVSCIKGFVLVASITEVEGLKKLVKEWSCRKLITIVQGGERRQDSVWEGLCALPSNSQIVLIHDGARPLIRVSQVERLISETVHWGAATLAVPVKDTVKESGSEGFVVRTIPRERLWLTQTPQAFFYSLLIEAHRRAQLTHALATDDAALVEATGHSVKLVEGSYTNIKITTPEDLELAEALFKMRWVEKNN